jgi:hypothetical protein
MKKLTSYQDSYVILIFLKIKDPRCGGSFNKAIITSR